MDNEQRPCKGSSVTTPQPETSEPKKCSACLGLCKVYEWCEEPANGLRCAECDPEDECKPEPCNVCNGKGEITDADFKEAAALFSDRALRISSDGCYPLSQDNPRYEVNCNDFFMYACSDSVTIGPGDPAVIRDLYRELCEFSIDDASKYTLDLFACRKKGCPPISPYLDRMRPDIRALFVAAGKGGRPVTSQQNPGASGGKKCRLCIEQGQPEHFGSPVRCAFPSGVFDADNWQCATLGALRDVLARLGHTYWSDDSHAALTPCLFGDGGFLLLGWYKHRGCTTSAVWTREGNTRLAILSEVEATLAALEGPPAPAKPEAAMPGAEACPKCDGDGAWCDACDRSGDACGCRVAEADWHPCHHCNGSSQCDEPIRSIDYRHARDKTDRAILEALSKGPLRPQGFRRFLDYSALPEGDVAYEVSKRLQRLKKAGAIELDGGKWKIAPKPAPSAEACGECRGHGYNYGIGDAGRLTRERCDSCNGTAESVEGEA